MKSTNYRRKVASISWSTIRNNDVKDISYYIWYMNINLVNVNNGKYNLFVIHNDRYLTPVLANGHEWDGCMREDV